jgi:hypothetical protein
MAVAFGRGCGFASGRSRGNWTPDGILQLEGEANISLSWAHEAHPALNRLMLQTDEGGPAPQLRYLEIDVAGAGLHPLVAASTDILPSLGASVSSVQPWPAEAATKVAAAYVVTEGHN